MGHSLSSISAPPGTATQGSNEEEKMRSPKERAKAAVLGAFVADAASMPLHRIYDQGSIEALLRGGEAAAAAQVAGSPESPGSDAGGQRLKTTASPCEFFSPCSCPFYTLPPGQSTPYGKEAFPILYSISSCGVFDKERASQLLFECMRGIDVAEDQPSTLGPAGPVRIAVSEAGSVGSASSGESRSGSSLDKSRLESADDFDTGASDGGSSDAGSTRYAAQLQADYRLNPKMLSTTSRQFLQARARGLSWDEFAVPHASLDAQGLGLVKVPLIVARYAGSPKLISMVENCVRIHQTSEAVLVVCRLAARLLERVVLGMTVAEALRWALAGGGKTAGSSETSSSSSSSSSSSASGAGAAAQVDAMPENERWYLQRILRNTAFGPGSGSSSAPAPCPFSVTAEGLGLDGQLPGCFLTTLTALHVFKDYKTAVRANMVAGGDSALRAWIIGSMLAAEGSEIPLQWKNKTALYQEVLVLATRVVGSNPAFDKFKEVNFCRVTL